MTRACLSALLLLAASVSWLRADDTRHVIVGGHAAHPTRILARRATTGTASAQATALATAGVVSIRESRLVDGLLVLEIDQADPSATTVAAHAKSALPPDARLLECIALLQASGQFTYVEPDYYVAAAATPNDTAFTSGLLWGLRNTGETGGLPGIDIAAEAAWDITTGSTEVVVSIVDSGMRLTHADLATQLWSNPGEIAGNGIDDDNNGYIDDLHGIDALTGDGDPEDSTGHGTAMAGTIGAAANNGAPLVGVAWKVRLMPCRFIGPDRLGATSDAIECISYAIAQGAQVINCSWGAEAFSQALEDAFAAARDADVVMVTAAGNSGFDNDNRPHYPSGFAFENILSVAGIGTSGHLWHTSNRGITTVDVAAPGASIYTTGIASDNSYTNVDGTSAAAAHVTGIAALVLAKTPEMAAMDVRDRIIATASTNPSLSESVVSGGRAHAYNALATLPDGFMSFRMSPHLGSVIFGGRHIPIQARLTDITVVRSATVVGEYFGTEDDAVHHPFVLLDDGIAPDQHADDGIYTGTIETPRTGTQLHIALTASAPGKSTTHRTFPYILEPPPPNDMFAEREIITDLRMFKVTKNRAATREDGEPEHAGDPGDSSVWWSWTAPADGGATVSTQGSPFDTVLGVYTGSSLDSLTEVASNDNISDTDTGSKVWFPTIGGTTYHIAVDGAGGEIGDLWFAFHGTISPPNDKFSRAIPIDGASAVVTGSTTDSLLELGEPDHTEGASTTYGSVWWTWTAPASGTARMRATSISGSSGGLLVVYVGSELTTLRRMPRTTADSLASVTFPALAGTTYSIAVVTFQSPGGGATSLEVTLEPGPANDNFAQRKPLAGVDITASGETTGATREIDEPDHIAAPLLKSSGTTLWWTWTAPADGSIEIKTRGTNLLTTISAYTGDSLASLTRVGGGFGQSGSNDAAIARFRVESGVAYQIVLDTQAERAGPVSLALKFHQPPPNDQFADRITLTGTSVRATGSNIGATGEPGEPDHIRGSGSATPTRATLWWEWIAPADGLTYVSSPQSTGLTIYTGSGLGDLSAVSDLEWPMSRPYYTTFQAIAGQRYLLAVDGVNTFTGACDVELFMAQPPDNDSFATPTRLPSTGGTTSGDAVGATAEPGEPSLLGSAPASSVWFTWTSPITGTATFRASGWVERYGVLTGSTLDTLILIGAQYGSLPQPLVMPVVAGSEYRILIDTKPGRARPYELTISTAAAPANDAFAQATVITGTDIELRATNAGASREPGEPSLTGGTTGATVWWSWTAPRSGRAIISAHESGFQPYIGVFTGSSLSSLTPVVRSVDAPFLADRHRVVFAVSAGTTYHIAIQGWDTVTGEIALALRLVDAPPNDDFANRTRISGSAIAIEGTNLGAMPESGDPSPVIHYAGLRTVWWRWTAPATGRYLVDTPTTTFLAQIGIYAGTSLAGLTHVASNTQTSLQIVESNVIMDAIAGIEYAIVLAGSLDDMGEFSLRLIPVSPPANDRWTDAVIVPPEGGTVSGTNFGASESADDAPGMNRRTVWWSWTAPASGAAGVSTEGSDFDTFVAVYAIAPTHPASLVNNNDDDARGLMTSRAPFEAVAGRTYFIQVGSIHGEMGTISLTLGMDAPPTKPAIVASSTAARETQPLVLQVEPNAGYHYVWVKNGTIVPGVNGPSLSLPSAQRFHAGFYQVTAYSLTGESTSDAVEVTVSTEPTSNARLRNLSTRALCETGDSVLIPGFYISGSGTKRLLMRAVGPELTRFGVSDALEDPQLVLKRQSDNSVVASNDNWGDNANWEEIRNTARALFAFGLTTGSKSAALLTDLPAGGYTVVSSGHGDMTGVAIVELYEVSDALEPARLINISNRGFVGVGGEIMIPGFVVSDEGSRTFLIRAVGPTLGRFNITGFLADPWFEIYKRRPGTAIDDLVLSNDTWGENGDAETIREAALAVSAFRLNDDSADAALVVTLPPGAYTVNAKGKGSATGVALVEVYLMP